MTDGPGRAISKEKLEKVGRAIEDGWPLEQIFKTYNTTWHTLRKYFPDYRGMNLTEAASLGGFTARQNRKMSRG